VPKFDRPDYRRLELWVPPELWAALLAKAPRNRTAFALKALAKALGVAYTPPPMGRRPKPLPDAAPAPRPRRK
jgi:hypothetical protein